MSKKYRDIDDEPSTPQARRSERRRMGLDDQGDAINGGTTFDDGDTAEEGGPVKAR